MQTHFGWSPLVEAFAVALGVLDGLSPQAWNVSGQMAGVTWRRTLSGVLPLIFTVGLLGTLGVWFDKSASLGMAHPLFAMASGVILIGVATSSGFAIVMDYATGGKAISRPMNLFSGFGPHSLRIAENFIPTPAAFGALFVALNAAETRITIIILASFIFSLLLGILAVAVSERTSVKGLLEHPSLLITRAFEYAPMFANALLVMAGAAIMHGSVEIDPYLSH